MGSPGMQRRGKFSPSDSLTADVFAPRPVWLDHPAEAKRSGALPLKPPTRYGRPYDAPVKR